MQRPGIAALLTEGVDGALGLEDRHLRRRTASMVKDEMCVD